MQLTRIPHRAHGVVTLNVVGETFKLDFSVNALCLLEAEQPDRMEIQQLLDPKGEGPKMATVRAALWAALQDHHPDVSVEDAGRLIDHLGLEQTGLKVGQALILALPEPKPGPRKAARRKRA